MFASFTSRSRTSARSPPPGNTLCGRDSAARTGVGPRSRRRRADSGHGRESMPQRALLGISQNHETFYMQPLSFCFHDFSIPDPLSSPLGPPSRTTTIPITTCLLACLFALTRQPSQPPSSFPPALPHALPPSPPPSLPSLPSHAPALVSSPPSPLPCLPALPFPPSVPSSLPYPSPPLLPMSGILLFPPSPLLSVFPFP